MLGIQGLGQGLCWLEQSSARDAADNSLSPWERERERWLRFSIQGCRKKVRTSNGRGIPHCRVSRLGRECPYPPKP